MAGKSFSRASCEYQSWTNRNAFLLFHPAIDSFGSSILFELFPIIPHLYPTKTESLLCLFIVLFFCLVGCGHHYNLWIRYVFMWFLANSIRKHVHMATSDESSSATNGYGVVSEIYIRWLILKRWKVWMKWLELTGTWKKKTSTPKMTEIENCFTSIAMGLNTKMEIKILTYFFFFYISL